jgi:molybdate transport system substrate-binding protein
VLAGLGLLDALRPKIVQGENIAQVQQFIASGNAELGFVALAQVWRDGAIAQGSAWVVPDSLHAPIRQDAALLLPGRGKPAAQALLAYLRGDEARAIIRSFGYELPAGRS